MRQLKATKQDSTGKPVSLYLRFIGKIFFMKGVDNSNDYVNQLIDDFESRGASIIKGNGGWMRIDIVKDVELVKLGDVEIDRSEVADEQIEDFLFDFYLGKYQEAGFIVQEIAK